GGARAQTKRRRRPDLDLERGAHLTVEQVDVDQERATGDHLARRPAATGEPPRGMRARADRGDGPDGGNGGGPREDPTGGGDRGGLHLAAEDRQRRLGCRGGKPADRIDGVLRGRVFLGDDLPVKVVVAHRTQSSDGCGRLFPAPAGTPQTAPSPSPLALRRYLDECTSTGWTFGGTFARPWGEQGGIACC